MASPTSMDHLKNLQSSQLFQQIESLKQPSKLDALLDSTQICKQLGIDGQSRRELQAQRTLFREQLEDLRDMLLEQVNCRSSSRNAEAVMHGAWCTCMPSCISEACQVCQTADNRPACRCIKQWRYRCTSASRGAGCRCGIPCTSHQQFQRRLRGCWSKIEVICQAEPATQQPGTSSNVGRFNFCQRGLGIPMQCAQPLLHLCRSWRGHGPICSC